LHADKKAVNEAMRHDVIRIARFSCSAEVNRRCRVNRKLKATPNSIADRV